MTSQAAITSLNKKTAISAIESEFLFQVRIPLYPAIDLGQTPNGHRMILMAKDGTFEGPKLRGKVISGGDWALVRGDRSGALDVRLNLKTHDGALLLMTYYGRMMAAEEDFEYALDFSKPDDPEGANRYYFRTNPLFETSDPRYAWLNHIVTIGKGRTGDHGVIYDVFTIK